MTSLPARIALAAASGLVALIIVALALRYLGEALFLCLATQGLDPAGAAALTGVAGLVVVGLIGLAVRLALRRPPRTAVSATPAATGSAANGIAADLGILVARQVMNSAQAHPYSTMGAALAAGLAVGAVPELRKALTGLLKP